MIVEGLLRNRFQSVLEYEDECEYEDDVLFSSFTRPRRRPRTRPRMFSNILSESRHPTPETFRMDDYLKLSSAENI